MRANVCLTGKFLRSGKVVSRAIPQLGNMAIKAVAPVTVVQVVLPQLTPRTTSTRIGDKQVQHCTLALSNNTIIMVDNTIIQSRDVLPYHASKIWALITRVTTNHSNVAGCVTKLRILNNCRACFI